jgi:hypothetical protein
VYHHVCYAIGVSLGERVLVLRVLLAAFVVLYGCTRTSSPVENKVKQGGVKQQGKRAGHEQADPERAAAQSTTPPPSNGAVPPISETACPKNAPIKGKAQSGIYHTRVSATYDETYPEECFASEAAARAAGYRAARD